MAKHAGETKREREEKTKSLTRSKMTSLHCASYHQSAALSRAAWEAFLHAWQSKKKLQSCANCWQRFGATAKHLDFYLNFTPNCTIEFQMIWSFDKNAKDCFVWQYDSHLSPFPRLRVFAIISASLRGVTFRTCALGFFCVSLQISTNLNGTQFHSLFLLFNYGHCLSSHRISHLYLDLPYLNARMKQTDPIVCFIDISKAVHFSSLGVFRIRSDGVSFCSAMSVKVN